MRASIIAADMNTPNTRAKYLALAMNPKDFRADSGFSTRTHF
jgi:hypothetical protein